MEKPRKQVVVGILGTRLDSGKNESRWSHWRPSVALCQHEELLVDRLELIHQPQERELAELLAVDIHSVSPETVVQLHALALKDPWDFEEVFAGLYGFTLVRADAYLPSSDWLTVSDVAIRLNVAPYCVSNLRGKEVAASACRQRGRHYSRSFCRSGCIGEKDC